MKSPYKRISINTLAHFNKQIKFMVDTLSERITELEEEVEKLKAKKPVRKPKVEED